MAANIIKFPEAEAAQLKLDAREAQLRGVDRTPGWGGRAFPNAVDKWRFDREVPQMDAGESLFFARQLEQIRRGVQLVQYTDIIYDELLPINRSVSTGKSEYTIQIMDGVGEAKVVDDMADDWPPVELSASEKSMKFFTIGIAYQYSLQEIRAAIDAGVPLQSMKAMMARQMTERKVNDIALLGSGVAPGAPGAPFGGLLTLTDSGTHTVTPSTGSGSGTTFLDSGKSSDELLADLHSLMSTPTVQTKGLYRVNTLLLPLSTRTFLSARRVGDGTNGSILSYFAGADPFIGSEMNVYGLWELESATAAGVPGAWVGKRAIAYRRDPACLEFFISQEFEQLPPQAFNAKIKTLCRMRLGGGIALYQPLTYAKMDNI